MLVAKRNAMSGKKLPYARRLAYLETNKTAWINTNYIIKSERFKRITDLMYLSLGMYVPSGSQISDTSGFGAFLHYNSSYGGLGICVGTYYRALYEQITAGRRLKIEITADNGVVTKKVNEAEVKTTTYGGTIISGVPIYLFKSNNKSNPTLSYNFHGRIYSEELWDNDKKVRSYIPVMSHEGNPEMFDEVTQTFAERHGDFLYGELDGGGV